jgi:hypothetical protein
MSNLLSQASLVMIPSGYKEDVVYSQIPTNGDGDLSFTRASNGTRINSAGLVEDVPWNLLEQSNSFNTTWAIGTNTTLTSGFSDPFGGSNAWRLTMTSGSGTFLQQTFTFDAVAYTFSVWAKANGNTNLTLQISGSSQESYVLTNEWQRITFTYTPTAGASQVIIGNGILSVDALIYGAQLNIGSTAKPYFPTTDRLNVPRLTYQNGGGGCPSLLLEKQSTNLVSYSQDFTNAYWSKTNQGVGSNAVITPNYTTSPDGTNNAFRLQCNLNGGTTSNDRSWMIASFTAPATSTLSIWIKLNSAGTKTFVFSDAGGGTKTISGTDWQRIDGTFVGAAGQFRIGLIGGSTSDTLDCSIWGAQAESGSYPTSYIPTTSSSATRVADACSKTGISSLIGQTEGTLFAEVEILNNAVGWILDASDGTTTNRTLFFKLTNNQIRFIRISTTQSSSTTVDSPIISLGVHKIALAYQSGNTAFFIDGVQISTTNTATFTNGTLNKISLGTAGDGSGNQLGDRISQAIIFPTRLTNAELASLTTL